MSTSHTSAFQFFDSVKIDDGTVIGRVIAFAFYAHGSEVKVSWWNNGTLVEQWIDDSRLKPASGEVY